MKFLENKFKRDYSINRELKNLRWFLLISPIDLTNKGQKKLKSDLESDLDRIVF